MCCICTFELSEGNVYLNLICITRACHDRMACLCYDSALSVRTTEQSRRENKMDRMEW